MKWRDLLGEWALSKLNLKLGFLDAEFVANDVDRLAAWELYVELATRVTTQPLPDSEGSDRAALDSIHSLFGTTRAILREHGPSAQNFARVAIAVLNVVLRPFLTRWHLRIGTTANSMADEGAEFRRQLEAIRKDLHQYAILLAKIADVEQLT